LGLVPKRSRIAQRRGGLGDPRGFGWLAQVRQVELGWRSGANEGHPVQLGAAHGQGNGKVASSRASGRCTTI